MIFFKSQYFLDYQDYFYLLIVFFKSFFAKNLLLNKENDWFNCQINHCLWDTGIRNNKNSLEKLK